jgi:type I restriction enzyme S subunit
MANNSTALKDLLAYTRDGEWGQDSPADDRIEMLVIRGTDFEAVRFGDLTGVPTRFIPQHIASNKQLRPNDILIETAGGSKGRPTGKTLLITERILGNSPLPVTCASFCRFLRVDETAADPEYVFWYLQHLYASGDTYNYQVQHTGIARFQYTVFAENTQISLPPLPEQREIARILGALDDKIEANRRANATLEATARALFQSWFVDFDPVRAKAEGRQPDGMDAETAALFPDSFEDSALGAVPAGWVVQPLSEHISAVKGLSYKGDGLADFGDGMPMHNLNSVYEGGGYKYDGIKHYTGEYQERHIATAGDLIVTNTEQGHDMLLIGYPALIPNNYPAGLFSHHLYRVTPLDGSHITSRFIYFLMRTDVFHEVIGGYTNGTTVNMLPVDGLQRPLFVVPPPELVARFDQLVAPILAKIEVNHDESETLAETRDTLLPKLISGEVRVGEIEGL